MIDFVHARKASQSRQMMCEAKACDRPPLARAEDETRRILQRFQQRNPAAPDFDEGVFRALHDLKGVHGDEHGIFPIQALRSSERPDLNPHGLATGRFQGLCCTFITVGFLKFFENKERTE